jgi:hypothetical protein
MTGSAGYFLLATGKLSQRRDKKHDRRPLRLAHRLVERLPALLKGGKVALADQEAVNVRHALLRGHVSARHETRFKERFVQ